MYYKEYVLLLELQLQLQAKYPAYLYYTLASLPRPRAPLCSYDAMIYDNMIYTSTSTTTSTNCTSTIVVVATYVCTSY